MTQQGALTLQAWLSPSYPVGAYAYSHGLEWAVEQGDVTDCATLATWIAGILRHGSGRNDAILFANAWRDAMAGGANLPAIAELAIALASSRERRLETRQQGAAFFTATRAAWPHESIDKFAGAVGENTAYCVCFAACAAAHGLPLRPALDGFLSAFAANLVSGAVRMNVVGQTAGQQTIAGLSAIASEIADACENLTLDDLGGSAFRADLAAILHETQHARLFRS